MSHDAMTFPISDETRRRLDAWVKATGRSPESFVSLAVDSMLDAEEEKGRAIDAALKEADGEGPWFDGDEVIAWVRSWGTERELSRPSPRTGPKPG